MTERKRCRWVNLKNPLYVAYHDSEWGKPVYEDGKLFEMLLLECFQAGLSWECILGKRAAFRAAFDGFDYRKIEEYTQEKEDALAQNSGIVRNRLKIHAAVVNARVFMAIQTECGSFSQYIWHFTDGKPLVHRDGVRRTATPLSDEIARDLKKRGMKFVGSTTIYAYLQAIGVANDHDPDCEFGA